MSANHVASKMFARFGFEVTKSPFQWNALGRNMACMVVQGIVAFLFVLFCESKFSRSSSIKKLLRRDVNYRPAEYEPLDQDSDVVNERERIIEKQSTTNDIVVVENLTKVFKKGQEPAVNRLWMSVGSGECFGLLGVNGAGKTTTFKMLTGDVEITDGNAFISGYR